MPMSDWQKAEAYIDNIDDPTVRRLAGFFLRHVALVVAQNKARPERGFDLEFFAKVVHDAVRHPELIRRLLDGEDVGRWHWPEDLFDDAEVAAEM